MLTSTQILSLRAAVIADTNLASARTNRDTQAIYDYYNAPTAGFYVWQTAVPTQVIYDAITWTNLTPADAADGTALWTNRALACQGKQFNLQTILQGRETINASRSTVRAGLQDALTGLPSGAAGVTRQAGWATVQTAMQRLATNGEKLFATGTGTTASPAVLVIEGALAMFDVSTTLWSGDGAWLVGG